MAKQLKRVKNKKFFNYKKRRGDRTDGWRVHADDPLFDVIPHVMPMRCDAQVFFEEEIEIEAMDKFMRSVRRDSSLGMPQLSRMIILLAALVRTAARYPKVNRFVGGRKIYARNHLCISFNIKRSMHIDAPETVVKPFFDPDFNLKEVYDAVMKAAEGTKGTDVEGGAMDKFVGSITAKPWLIRPLVNIFTRMDKKKGTPKWFHRDLSPFHTSCFVTDIGSLGIGSVYHHIYNFGTTSLFASMGKIHKKLVLDDNGDPKNVNAITMRYVADERISDGFYMAKTVRYLNHLLAHPEVLLDKPAEVLEDTLR